jgi:hypothetical protein
MRNSTTKLEGFADPIRKESSIDATGGKDPVLDPTAREESTNNNGSVNNGSKPLVSKYITVLFVSCVIVLNMMCICLSNSRTRRLCFV